MSDQQHKIVGVDVGGTFTDLMLIDEAAGDIRVAKVPTTPDNQAFGVLAALAETGEADPKPLASRPVWFESGIVETPIYRRRQIAPGATLSGPAIIEQLDTTTVVEPGNTVVADAHGNLIIPIAGESP